MAEVQEKEPPAVSTALLTGKLGSSFAAASDIGRLHRRLLDSQPESERPHTGAVLDAFYAAAEKLKAREEEFTQRRRPAPDAGRARPDLKANLRSPEHFAALRAFKGVGADIVALNPDLGSALVKAVEKNIVSPAVPPKPGA